MSVVVLTGPDPKSHFSPLRSDNGQCVYPDSDP
jgi:hypothetical protein